MAATILGHGHFATTERHYNLAQTLEAAHWYQEIIRARRVPARRRTGEGQP
jgi:hypothetical protein